ncbi:MAG: hypothetical protein ACHQ4H_17840, partial [Ktedonobacterales bacterium]
MARAARGHRRSTRRSVTYGGIQLMLALLVALLALFCAVIVEQRPLARAIHIIRGDPFALDRQAVVYLGIAAAVPVACGVLAWMLSALAIPVIRVSLYVSRLHRAVEGRLRAAPLYAAGIEPLAVVDTGAANAAKRLPLTAALASQPRLLLIGEAGGGMTTALYALAAARPRPRTNVAQCLGRRQ